MATTRSEADPSERRRRATEIAKRALRESVELIGISTPSGDREAAELAVEATLGMLPPEAEIERIPCSSPDHAPDLLARVRGDGRARIVLVGHLDTVVAHDRHRPATVHGGMLIGSGSVDMKGGDAIALGLLRDVCADRTRFGEVTLLMVNDEEFRLGPFIHGPRFDGFDACLCFEGGDRLPDGGDAVVVERKAAAAIRIAADGVAAHSGADPEAGRSALLGLAEVAQRLARLHDLDGPRALSVVPTILRSGEAINAVPGAGELFVDMRAEREDAFEAVLDAVPNDLNGVGFSTEWLRLWPGMNSREVSAATLMRASELLGRPIAATARGGASDASNLAPHVPLSIDGLGPLGGYAHNPEEYLLIDSLEPRAELAMALLEALLDRPAPEVGGTGPPGAP